MPECSQSKVEVNDVWENIRRQTCKGNTMPQMVISQNLLWREGDAQDVPVVVNIIVLGSKRHLFGERDAPALTESSKS